MNKLKKILKVLWDMFEDGVTHLLVFVGLFIIAIVLAIIVFSPAIICTIIFGGQIGVIVLLCEVGALYCGDLYTK